VRLSSDGLDSTPHGFDRDRAPTPARADLDSLCWPAELLLVSRLDCELPKEAEVGVIPIMSRAELAAMLLRLEEAGLSLEM
jgi:hypothetical protein